MHSIIRRWLAFALFAGLVLAGASLAQPPGLKEGPPNGIAPAAPLGVDDVVERIMAFDRNGDGKVTRDELPERMHHLIELGDLNRDGALDREEIRKLAARMVAAPGGFGAGGPVRGFGGGGQIRLDGAGPGLGPVEGVVDDLKLSGKKKEQAMAAVKAHEENVRKLMDQARAELLEKMKEILSEEEFQDFRAALDRPRGVNVFRVGPRDAPRGGGQQKADPPQK
jgi:hypothetical protein